MALRFRLGPESRKLAYLVDFKEQNVKLFLRDPLVSGKKIMDEHSLKSFGEIISLLIARQDLPRKTARQMFCDILSDIQPELHQGACLAALRMKGETDEEIVGCFEAIYAMDTNKVELGNIPLVENCGTGMDSLKTFNISTLSAVVAASAGVPMARHGSRAITSSCGTVDLCEALGVDVECDVSLVQKSITTCGLGLFNGMSPHVHPGGLGRILSQIRFGSTLNIAASLANPALPKIAVRGVGAPDQIKSTISVMKKIGYQKALVFHGLDRDENQGMDELSTLGISMMGILKENGEIEFTEIHPEQVGISKGNYEEIRPKDNIEEEALCSLQLLAGRAGTSRTDIVALNAGAILWVSDKTKSLEEGIEAAKNEIQSGRCLTKLMDWTRIQNREPELGLSRVRGLCRKGGMPG